MAEVLGSRQALTSKEIHIEDFEKSYETAKEDLIKFTEKQIELMNNNLLFGGSDSPSFYDLNQSLMNFESVMLGLTSLHAQVRYEKDIANEKYDNFFAVKYFEIKTAMQTLDPKKSPTQKEIEMKVRVQHMGELAALKAECIRLENEWNTVNHLISAWDKYAFVLNTLSKNTQAEATAAGIASKHPYEFGDEDMN